MTKKPTKNESAETAISTLMPGKPDDGVQYTPLSPDEVVICSTKQYLADLSTRIASGAAQISDRKADNYENVSVELLKATNKAIRDWNADCDKGLTVSPIKKLDHFQLGQIAIVLHHAVRLALGGLDQNPDQDRLAIYVDDPTSRQYGIYSCSRKQVIATLRRYAPRAVRKDLEEAYEAIFDSVERQPLVVDRDLIPLNNGVFNYRTKELLPFSPDYFFMSKSHVDYVKDAPNVVIMKPDGTKWDVESWINSLTDDPEVAQLLWECIGASLRPHVAWDKAFLLYSTRGRNGKGTLCDLVMNLVGRDSVAFMGIKDMAGTFSLAKLPGCQVVMSHENKVRGFIDDATVYKALVTHDPLTVNPKNKDEYMFEFNGTIWQCINQLPRYRDTTGSLARRQLYIPFDHDFSEEGFDPAIKEDYVTRPEVLQYVVYKTLALMDDYYKLSEPQACKDLLEEYKVYNDPKRQFIDEFFNEVEWDFVPSDLVYATYRKWYAVNIAERKDTCSKREFIEFINKEVLAQGEYPEWRYAQPRISTVEKLCCQREHYMCKYISGYSSMNWDEMQHNGYRKYLGGNRPYGFMRVNANQNNNDFEEE